MFVPPYNIQCSRKVIRLIYNKSNDTKGQMSVHHFPYNILEGSDTLITVDYINCGNTWQTHLQWLYSVMLLHSFKCQYSYQISVLQYKFQLGKQKMVWWSQMHHQMLPQNLCRHSVCVNYRPYLFLFHTQFTYLHCVTWSLAINSALCPTVLSWRPFIAIHYLLCSCENLWTISIIPMRCL